ncbi:uncharacterized protein LOC116255543 [Nymphaea colorata]|nr:uncharacterized protein LOC116255543 [Nymphaea colorata]
MEDMVASSLPQFAEEEMVVDQTLGFPIAYAKLCRDPDLGNPYTRGPPFTFTPYILEPREALRVKEMNMMFPIVDPDSKPIINPKKYTELLWKRLNHLGNAGFDPDKFRVDHYGNVLYFHADPASPLAWDIDHWFPYARGGKTVPSNLRIVQKKACRKKRDALEFLLPWWDLQLGISVNQFLMMFTSRNSDFRQRAFSLLFSESDSGDLNDSQVCISHAFPLPFEEKKRRVGLAPAAIVQSNRDLDAQILKTLDFNRPQKKISWEEDEVTTSAVQKHRLHGQKENDADLKNNQIVASSKELTKLREGIENKKTEISKLDEELTELKRKNDEERIALQELETVLIKRKRRVEKCRQVSEAQSSYRGLLEKMIRDAMHQNVVYKEQVRLNQAATASLMARLEAQKAICDSSERELQKRFKQRQEIERLIIPEWEKVRKRSRMEVNQVEERLNKTCESSITVPRSTPESQKELRLLLEEDRNASEEDMPVKERDEVALQKQKGTVTNEIYDLEECKRRLDDKFKSLVIEEGKLGQACTRNKTSAVIPRGEEEGDQEYRKKIGKVNLDNWLRMLLDDTEGGSPEGSPSGFRQQGEKKNRTEELVRKLNNANQEIKILKLQAKDVEVKQNPADVLEEVSSLAANVAESSKHVGEDNACRLMKGSRINGEKNITTRFVHKPIEKRRHSKSFDADERSDEGHVNGRGYGSTPASPCATKKEEAAERVGQKPVANADDNGCESIYEENQVMNNFIKVSIKTCSQALKKAMKK